MTAEQETVLDVLKRERDKVIRKLARLTVAAQQEGPRGNRYLKQREQQKSLERLVAEFGLAVDRLRTNYVNRASRGRASR